MASLYRILNLCWATLVTSVVVMLCLLQLPDPSLTALAGVVFWSTYLFLAVGTFFDVRVAWLLGIVQLVAVWLLMGVGVSERSFGLLTGQHVDPSSPASIGFVVFNSFFGVLVPASTLLIILLFTRQHLRWLFSRHGRSIARLRRERKEREKVARRAARRLRRAA